MSARDDYPALAWRACLNGYVGIDGERGVCGEAKDALDEIDRLRQIAKGVGADVDQGSDLLSQGRSG